MMRVLLYLPVLHAGYEGFLRKATDQGAVEILVMGRSISDEFPELRKEVRALRPARAVAYLNSVANLAPAHVVEREGLRESVGSGQLVLPDEEICRAVVRKYGLRKLAKIRYDRTFLRWDRKTSGIASPPGFEGRVSATDADRAIARIARLVGYKSSDWWRQVGALAVLNGRVVAQAYNQHLPHEYSPYMNSDPRNAYSRGKNIDRSTAVHAEARLIAECAKLGQPLEGADLFVSTFPCPSCARLIACAGFRRCFFSEGYSVLDGGQVMRSAGVELIYVDAGEEDSESEQLTIEDVRGASSIGEIWEELERQVEDDQISPLRISRRRIYGDGSEGRGCS